MRNQKPNEPRSKHSVTSGPFVVMVASAAVVAGEEYKYDILGIGGKALGGIHHTPRAKLCLPAGSCGGLILLLYWATFLSLIAARMPPAALLAEGFRTLVL